MIDNERMVVLVRQAKLGDSHSFAELYNAIYQDLYRTALYTLGNPDDAENVVSDTVLDAYAGISKLYDERKFRAWIFRILSNKCNRKIREYVKRRETEAEKSIDDMAEMLSSRDNSMEQVENQTLVQKAFSVLSEEEKEIVTLTIYGEYDSGEVAGIMNLNRNTVRSKYSRALAKMRECLGGTVLAQE
jgi:RNA polymerase sigma factor, sigma-70 family